MIKLWDDITYSVAITNLEHAKNDNVYITLVAEL